MKESEDLILAKMEHYCVYQERCISDVRNKLKKLSLSAAQQDNIIHLLLKNRYIDEDRFTSLFIRSKIASCQWGKIKLRQELFKKQIDKEIINRHIRAIKSEDYLKMMQIALSKWLKIHPENTENKPKIFAFLLSKGYTINEIRQII